MESSLEAFNVVSKVNHHAKEGYKTLQQEVENHVKALQAFKGEVFGLWEKFHDSLQQDVHGVYGA